MTWPQAMDYNAAVQNPQVCFRDDDLRQGQVVGDMFGLPCPHSGNFADVYQIRNADNQSWAVKCFTRPVAGLHQRYQAISDHLHQAQRAFMVQFRYLEEGICIRGQWYPIVKMRWVEGFTLNEFIRQHLDKPVLLDRLAQMWLRLGQELRDADMAHGDLQHGNVLLVPGSKSSSLALKLIDYDGMFVPALADTPSGELGHPNYQHPQRLREGAYDRELDRFAHLLIYTALRCVQVGGAALWERYDNLENLLFREEDFRRPSQSRLLRELWGLTDRDAHDLVGHLILASQGPLVVVPSLDELVEEKVVRPLTGSEEAQVNALLGHPDLTPRRSRVAASAQTLPTPAETAAAEIDPSPVAVLVAPPAREGDGNASAQATTPESPRAATPPPLPRSFRPLTPEVGREGSSARKGRNLTNLFDPLVAVLSRPGWMAALGLIALVSFLMVNVLVWYFVRNPPVPATPAAPGARLQSLDDVILKGGQKREVLLRVDRNDCAEALGIKVEGLPAEMQPPMPSVAADQDSASLALLAPLDFELPSRDVLVSLWQGDRRLDEQPFRLTVHKVPQPRLLKDKLESIHCKAGETAVFKAEVGTHGCQEPFRLRFEDLPQGVRQQSLPGPVVELTASPDAPPVKLHPVRLTLIVGEVTADTAPLFFNIEQAAPRVRFKREEMPEALTLKPGQEASFPVDVQRDGYPGPIEIELDGLPLGVTATYGNLSANTSSTTMALRAMGQMKPGRSHLKVIARVDGKKIDEREVRLTVEEPAPGARPAAPEPERHAGNQERVTFSTLDHVHLVGSFYPGSRGKKGACVLLLHDLGSHRAVPAWERLAAALQAAGHTVLTFDFRGHGDSKGIDLAFWNLAVNSHLPQYDPEKLLGEQPSKIEAVTFPGSYVPWLAHDIAAARMFLDLRHDDPASPVNTFNLVVIGAGQSSALGALWLASEGVRFEPVGEAINVKPPPSTKLSVLQAVWLGLDAKLNGQTFPVYNWLLWAHQAPVVPIAFVYGADDEETAQLLQVPLGSRMGTAESIPASKFSGLRQLSKDPEAEKRIHKYLAKTLHGLKPQRWAARHIKDLRSYWRFPTKPRALFFEAKRPGEMILRQMPLRDRFEIQMPGLQPRPHMAPGPFDK
jgi:pimeloyl-ACP methyl ester carboxylesterase